jgi:hypothetical protein
VKSKSDTNNETYEEEMPDKLWLLAKVATEELYLKGKKDDRISNNTILTHFQQNLRL